MRKNQQVMNGLTADQINYHLDHIDDYVAASNASTGSKVDENANQDIKTIASLRGDVHKTEDVQINRSMIQEQLVKTFGSNQGRRLAKQYLRDLEDRLIYTHDETALLLPYCAAITLAPMLQYGTRPLGGKSGPPKHLTAYIGQLINTVFSVSSQIAGAVGIPEFLLHFDAFARNDFGDDYLTTHEFDIKQALQTFVYTINEPAGARNGQSPFVNISIFDRNYFDALFAETTYYPTMPDVRPNWDTYSKLQKYFLDMIREENTKEVITFPVKTATILHDGEKPLDPEFVDMLADDLSRGSQMFLYLSTSVDSLSSCCRLRSDIDVHGFSHSLGAGGVSTGSLNVITLNLNRIVQDNKNLKSIVDRVHKYQVAHRKIFERFSESGLYPMYTGGYIDMDRQFLTVGFNGIVEAAESLGIPANDNPAYRDFVDKVLKTISEANKAAQKQYGYKMNMEQVPAEGLGIKNANWDREDGYRVPRNCYNSYMFPVEDPKLSVVDKLRLHGGEVCKHCDGGQACHINLDENPSADGYKALIDLAVKTGCAYFTTNVIRTSCEDCHKVEFSKLQACPTCGSKNISYATRIIGYLKIPAFSEGRQQEASVRAYTDATKLCGIPAGPPNGVSIDIPVSTQAV